ncbi:MAG: site-specific integrase [Alphaproteobacteria bacterium]|nr:site-specific integrase [Alphaproteobacteria bacterium]
MPLINKNKVKLTKRVVESAAVDPTKRIEIWDTEVTGFYVRVYPTGKKTYFLQFRNKNRESRKIKIGAHGSITTELAREQAIKFSLEIAVGADPSIKVVTTDKTHTMQELGEKYLALHANLKKKPKGYKEDSAAINNIILKKFGNLNVEAISTFDLQKLHAELKDTPYKANRLRALLSKMFTLANNWGWRLDNPVRGIERYQEYKRHRWLNDEEVQGLFSVLDTYYNQSVADVIRLLLLTGSRRNEVLHATWNQFDLEKGVWTKPAHSTKQKNTQHLPLSSLTLEMLKDMKAESESPFLFPGKIPGKPMQEIKKAWDTIRKRAGLPEVRMHDLRHTHASHLVSSGLSLSIVGKLLGHTQAATTQRYAHLADEPLRQATEVFGSKMERLTTRRD